FTFTVNEPMMTRPWFVGGLLNDVPGGGMCGGMFCATLSFVAAARLLTFTFVDSAVVSCPANGSGVGVGVAPPGEGTSRMCVSLPVTGSFMRAAGFPLGIACG